MTLESMVSYSLSEQSHIEVEDESIELSGTPQYVDLDEVE